MYVCMYVSIYVCMYVCMYVNQTWLWSHVQVAGGDTMWCMFRRNRALRQLSRKRLLNNFALCRHRVFCVAMSGRYTFAHCMHFAKFWCATSYQNENHRCVCPMKKPSCTNF